MKKKNHKKSDPVKMHPLCSNITHAEHVPCCNYGVSDMGVKTVELKVEDIAAAIPMQGGNIVIIKDHKL